MSDPTNVLRILFMGAGAVGQGVGGFLAAAGHEVALVLRGRYRDALAREGLRVEGIFGDRHVHPDRLTLAT
ncbi:MAG TPA: 2-dehydropantoate 2-reductase N-terminal domain-containing protein, partial [Phycisphaerae bacterium]|nr:2-dehydropantoate 2-reductase N-terminal domain-containing protein [Phycisphaerae bacterium]